MRATASRARRVRGRGTGSPTSPRTGGRRSSGTAASSAPAVAGLEPGVDVVRPRRRLERRERVRRVAPDAARDEVEAALEVAGRGRRHRPRLDRRSSAPGARRAAAGRGRRTRRANRDPDLRRRPARRGPPRRGRSAIAGGQTRLESSGSAIARPAADRRRRATCSASSVGLPPGPGASRRRRRRAGSRDRRPTGAAVGRASSRPSTQTWPGGRARHSPVAVDLAPADRAERSAALATVSSHSRGRVALVGDPAADVERQPAAVGDERPDEDRRRHRPVRARSSRARPVYGPRRTGSRSSRISIARIFGAPVIEPPGNEAASRSKRVAARRRAAGHGRDEVLDGGRPLEAAEARDADGARDADAAEVVAQDVDDHHVLGPVLGAGEELARERPVLLARPAARPGALDRVASRRRRPASTDRNGSGDADRIARGRPVSRTRAEVEVRREQRRIAGPQPPVERPRVAVERRREAAGQVGLVDVAAGDELADRARRRASYAARSRLDEKTRLSSSVVHCCRGRRAAASRRRRSAGGPRRADERGGSCRRRAPDRRARRPRSGDPRR